MHPLFSFEFHHKRMSGVLKKGLRPNTERKESAIEKRLVQIIITFLFLFFFTSG